MSLEEAESSLRRLYSGIEVMGRENDAGLRGRGKVR